MRNVNVSLEQMKFKSEMNKSIWEVVVAQLVEWSLPIPEVRGSNPVIGKNLLILNIVNCLEKTKIKKKRPGMAHY